MAKAKAEDREWNFVNVASPAELKNPATKRVIRSYTTRIQHEKAGKIRRTESPILPSPAPLPSSATPPPGSENDSADLRQERDEKAPLPQEVAYAGRRQSQWTVYTPLQVPSPTIQPHDQSLPEKREYALADLYQTRDNQNPLFQAVVRAAKLQGERAAETPLYDNAHLMTGATNFDPFKLCPVPYKPWFSFIIDHWHNRVMPVVGQVTGITWDLVNFRAETEAVMWSDPALFYIGILASTAIPISEGVLPLGKALWVREKAIQALNEALADPNSARVTSTPVILAIGLLAYHEHRHGNRALARDAHRPVQHELIKRRGKPLDISNSHLKTCSFMDAVMAAETNTPKYFALAYETISLRAKAVSAKDLERVNEELIKPRRPHPGYDSGYESDNWHGEKPDNEADDGVSVKHEPSLSPSLAVRLRETAPS